MAHITEPQEKREHLAALLTNLLFLVADLMETLGVECEEMNARCGFKMKLKESRHFEFAMKHIKALRSVTRGLDATTQESFGSDAELLADLVYAAVSRTGSDDKLMYEFLEHIMQYPDRVGLDGIRNGGDAFQRIKREQAKRRLDAYIKDNL